MADSPEKPRGWDLSSTCRGAQAVAQAHGRKIALAETGAQALAQALSIQARVKFGTENPAGKAVLDALAASRAVEQLRQLGERLLESADWGVWLARVEVPPTAPIDFPEFSLDEEIDLEPESPFIEMTAKVTTIAGKKMVVQCRLQKWYQPNLGELLYEESRRIEKRFKAHTMMAVVLMWPSADGPGVTGHYRTTDTKGRKIDFRYEVRRAWEMPPEGSLASPGTMMLVPLSKGAEERMPELVRLMKDRLAKIKPEPRLQEVIWAAFYWSMGMVCTLEESHALLGDLLPMIQATPDYKKVYGEAFRRGYAHALSEGPILALRDLVREQARRHVGDDPAGVRALEAVDSLNALKSIAGRVPTATSWSDLLGGATSLG